MKHPVVQADSGVQVLSSFEKTQLFFAVRYAIGRKSISSCMFPTDIIKNMDDRLDVHQKNDLSRDIRNEMLYYSKDKWMTNDLLPWDNLQSYFDSGNRWTIETKDGSVYNCFKRMTDENYIPVNLFLTSPDTNTMVIKDEILKVERCRDPSTMFATL